MTFRESGNSYLVLSSSFFLPPLLHFPTSPGTAWHVGASPAHRSSVVEGQEVDSVTNSSYPTLMPLFTFSSHIPLPAWVGDVCFRSPQGRS